MCKGKPGASPSKKPKAASDRSRLQWQSQKSSLHVRWAQSSGVNCLPSPHPPPPALIWINEVIQVALLSNRISVLIRGDTREFTLLLCHVEAQ